MNLLGRRRKTNNKSSSSKGKTHRTKTLPSRPLKTKTGNEFESEAVPGALPRGQNNPKVS